MVKGTSLQTGGLTATESKSSRAVLRADMKNADFRLRVKVCSFEPTFHDLLRKGTLTPLCPQKLVSLQVELGLV